MLHKILGDPIEIGCSLEEYQRLEALEQRRIYLSGEINSIDMEDSANLYLSNTEQIAQHILSFNKQDANLPPEQRTPIKLFINSPGGNISEGFHLVAIIELSKTPVYTINTSNWASMAFWVGISGHRRFSLPYSEFLLHEGSLFTAGSVGSVQDTVEFNRRYKAEVIKKHVLRHSNMSSEEYDSTLRREFYMLPEDAIKYGFIDEIITDIDTIL